MLNRRKFLIAAASSPLNGAVGFAAGSNQEYLATAKEVFVSRSAAKEWLASGARLRNGEIFVADQEAYRWRNGAAWIPDMPNVVPQSVPSPKHFGFDPNMRWRQLQEGDLDGINAKVYGPYREAGTNAINGFLLADRYAREAGMGLCRAVGDYFVRSYIRKRADGVQSEWLFDFFAERPDDIRVAIYRADVHKALPKDHGLFGSEIAELVHAELSPSEYSISLHPNGMGGIIRYTPEAGSYIDVCRQFDIKAKWSHSHHLWTNFQTFQIGLNLAASGATWDGDRVIGQYSYPASKPSNRGEHGIVLGSSTGYYTSRPPTKRSDVTLRALICRAASVKKDDNDPFVDSDPSTLTGVFGWITRPNFKVGTFGRSNTKSNMLFLAHWGGKYTPPGGIELLDKTSYALEETWHPEDVKLVFLSQIDRGAHGFKKGWELAAVAGADIGAVTHIGVSHPYWIGVGDVSDAFACDEQRKRVNRAKISVSHQTAIKIAPDPNSEYYGVLYKGTGTSKFEKYPGTDISLQRHGELNVICEGHTIEAVTGTLEAVRLRQFRGCVDLGDCRLFNAKKALYVLGGDGKWTAQLQKFDGLIHVRNNARGSLQGTMVGGPQFRSLGSPLSNTQGGSKERATLYAEGQIFSFTTRTAVKKGATKLPIHALKNAWHDINAGDQLDIELSNGSKCSVHATGLFVNGAMSVGVTELPCDLPENTTVIVAQKSVVTLNNAVPSSIPVWLYATVSQDDGDMQQDDASVETAYITNNGKALGHACKR